MIKINYEYEVANGDTPMTGVFVRRLTARGETPEEVRADAQRQIDQLGARHIQAVGFHNTRSDWEAMFGPAPECRDTAFYDPILECRQEAAAAAFYNLPWWKRMFRR